MSATRSAAHAHPAGAAATGETLIPVNQPVLDDRELVYVRQALETGWISSDGPFVQEFERAFAAFCGRRHGIAVCNGSAALQVATAALNLEPGDEVIMPTFTIIACAGAVIERGAIPVLVDSDRQTWNMEVRQVADRITPRTRAIMPVHIYGHPVDMDPVLALARRHGVAVIEDAAEVHGAEYKGRRCGSMGDLSTFSFYANKIVTTGEGGMLVTDDDALAERCRLHRNLCFQGPRRFIHQELGRNFRMTNLQAAVGVAQMERIESSLAKKRWIGETYTSRLNATPGLLLPVERPWAKHVYWVYGVVLDDGVPFDAAEFARRLAERGVQTRPFFWPMHEQPVFERLGLFRRERYPVAEWLARRGLYLPSGMGLTESQIDRVCDAVHAILGTP
jgi:perosamine synthetase